MARRDDREGGRPAVPAPTRDLLPDRSGARTFESESGNSIAPSSRRRAVGDVRCGDSPRDREREASGRALGGAQSHGAEGVTREGSPRTEPSACQSS